MMRDILLALESDEPLKRLQELRQSGVNLTIADEEGWTLEILAAETGDPKLVEFAKEVGCDFTRTTRHGWATGHGAVRSGNPDVVRLVSKLGSDLTVADERGRTPRHVAESSGKSKLVQAVDEAILAKEAEKSAARTMSNVEPPLEPARVLGQAPPTQEVSAAERVWNEQRTAERKANFTKALDEFEASFEDPNDLGSMKSENASRPVDDYLKQEDMREAARAAIRAQFDVDRVGAAGRSKDDRRAEESQMKLGMDMDEPER